MFFIISLNFNWKYSLLLKNLTGRKNISLDHETHLILDNKKLFLGVDSSSITKVKVHYN